MSRSSLEKFIHRMTRPWSYCRFSKRLLATEVTENTEIKGKRQGEKFLYSLPLFLFVSVTSVAKIFASRPSAEFFFQPGDLFVIVVADGAAGLTHHRADFFEGVAQRQQVKNLSRALIHTRAQLFYQNILIQFVRDVISIARDLARALRQNLLSRAFFLQFGLNQALVGLEEIGREIGDLFLTIF